MVDTAVVLSVNLGRPQQVSWLRSGRTSIEKTAVTGAVRAEPLGLAGDEVSDKRHHGGPDKAVYAFAREDLDRWADVLGQEVPDGMFGENLTTRGLDVNGAVVGERWHVGGAASHSGAVFEVASFRTPCQTFKAWLARNGYDATAWVKRFTQDARPGAYLRVVVPGEVGAGDPVEVGHRPEGAPSITAWFRDVHSL